MNSPSAPSPRPVAAGSLAYSGAGGFGLVELRAQTPFVAQLLPTGTPFALRHDSTLINQLLPGPAEDGLFRLLLRWRDAAGEIAGWTSLVGGHADFAPVDASCARWRCSPRAGLAGEALLQLHPQLPAWAWRIHVHNNTGAPLAVDLLYAQDLGLADEAAVRSNEAYTSHYIDWLPVADPILGWTLLARQNQAMKGGRHPWLAVACADGAAAFCTDGQQFFGSDHRLTNQPAAASSASLPSTRLQQEFALAGLQSRLVNIAPGESRTVTFVARFVDDHPAASAPGDLDYVRELLQSNSPAAFVFDRADSDAKPQPTARSLFISAGWLHGDSPGADDWPTWFPGVTRHEERTADGRLLSFFHGEATHVVSRDKDAAIARPHGHILRSGDSRWFDLGHFGMTCFAAGIFSAQAYFGHPSFARLLSIVRNSLNLSRGSGQRVFVRRNGDWQQLGVPSAFAMTPGDARWIYRAGADVLELRAWCDPSHAAAYLELSVVSGAPAEFLVTHEIVVGAMEFEFGGTVELNSEHAWALARPAPDSLVGRNQPGVCFAIASTDPAQVRQLDGDALLHADGRSRGGPYVVLQTTAVRRTGVLLLGSLEGCDALAAAIAAARHTFSQPMRTSAPPRAPAHLTHADPAVGRINDVLPWFAHNAAIHFSAPHGLEQYGGAAWGVRDVTQGSIEWLLASGDFAVARRVLETVFAQQYREDGGWPQWFMLPPYRFIQQAHSHGDVCFWPVKALCDYVEASNDFGLLRATVGYTDRQRFELTGPEETLLIHCDRVIAQCEARFVPGTALVNYGDGDWDDTLQPADPTLRTRMVSAWTVGLAFHTFRQLAEVCRRAGEPDRAERLDALCGRMRQDFARHLMPGGTVAGFLVNEADGTCRPLLHPSDAVTRIRYRLLPMTRSILAELFTLEEAQHHLALIERELLFPDGVRLMSEPCPYRGGVERLFKRAETAANVGREIGLQYVHAHLRYAEALAKTGDADGLWTALQVVNPVALSAIVPHAAPRQSNVYFSSSDADFADRYEAERRWPELRTGQVPVRGGWRLYSSGPGLFLHAVRACLLGVRESFADVVFDPVLPRSLDGLVATTHLCGRSVELHYRIRERTSSLRSLAINGTAVRPERRERNPYRAGGLIVAQSALLPLLRDGDNLVTIDL